MDMFREILIWPGCESYVNATMPVAYGFQGLSLHLPTCPQVKLQYSSGENRIEAKARRNGQELSDACVWKLISQ